MIEVKNLVKKYGNQFAVNDISFIVEEGKIYGLLGPNGAGKSTCMNIMTGYIAASSGEVKINGHDIMTDAEEAKKFIGYLPEIPPLYPDMTVMEYLNFVAELKKVSRATRDQEIEDVMAKTFITDMKNKLIKHLSKGYKQRVGIAQALLGNPQIIILDEPTVGLDPEQIIEIRTLIKSLKKDHTVILSSHILSEISAVCDDVLMIAKGKVVAMDTTENILKMNKSGQNLAITVKGNASKASEVLNNLKCIESYELVSEKDGQASFNIIAKDSEEDIREEISFALSDARILIIEMNASKASLEDVYLDILQDCREEEEADAEADETDNDDKADDAEEMNSIVWSESEDNEDEEGGEE